MNSDNLIKLGAMAQKKFNMKDNFKIMAVPSDTHRSYRIAVMNDFDGYNCGVPDRYNIDYDDVLLEKFGSSDNFEFIRVGYSPRANILLIAG